VFVGCCQTGHRVAGQAAAGDCKAIGFVEPLRRDTEAGLQTLWFELCRYASGWDTYCRWAVGVTHRTMTVSTLDTAVNRMNTEQCVLCDRGSFRGKIVLPSA
jgi:hypothetical protein